MGKLRGNYSKSFQYVQDRFTGEVGKLFDKEHHGCKCTNSVFIRVLFCALCHAEVQSGKSHSALCVLHFFVASW